MTGQVAIPYPSANDERWQILFELAQILQEEEGESRLRRELSPGALQDLPAGSRHEAIATLCNRLDEALNALTILEIGHEIQDVSCYQPEKNVERDLKILFQSPAFLQYVNTYLYFGVRFLAYRIDRPAWATGVPLTRRDKQNNDRSFALESPPELTSPVDRNRHFSTHLNMTKKDSGNRGLKFLDNTVEGSEADISDEAKPLSPVRCFELWLLGLGTSMAYPQDNFATYCNDLIAWSVGRTEFYLSLASSSNENAHVSKRPLGGLIVPSALAARFALLDIYWIARLLRADFLASGRVRYRGNSWLHLLRVHAKIKGNNDVFEKLRNAEEVLRSVFDFVCELVQNSIDISAERELRIYAPDLFPKQPESASQATVCWREVFDQELEVIQTQRSVRGYPPSLPAKTRDNVKSPGRGWTRRVVDGSQPHNLVGLAFSGGGIRSATFCLGALQGLQELDLLRQIDYLSTVSGGGFIGSWLVGNVKRSNQWLGRLTPWDESIAHLRRYSNYLAPLKSVFSADLWSLVGAWLRNAFLLQLNGLAWLFTVLSLVLLGKCAFYKIGSCRFTMEFAAASMIPFVGICLWNLCPIKNNSKRPSTDAYIFWFAVVPALAGSFLTGTVIAEQCLGTASHSYAHPLLEFGDILHGAWCQWKLLLGIFGVAIFVFSIATVKRGSLFWTWSICIALACSLIVYVQLCGIVWLLLKWSREYRDQAIWTAYALTPAMVLLALTVGISLFIGLCGRFTEEKWREWWTRLGAMIGIWGAAPLALTLATVYGPFCTLLLMSNTGYAKLKWGAVAAWLSTVISGLFAAKSGKTKGTDSQPKSLPLELLAKAASMLFIVGALFVSATLLALLVANLGGTEIPRDSAYWCALNKLNFCREVQVAIISLPVALLFSVLFDINIFGLTQIYRNRLVRCYLGATRWASGFRKPDPFTRFDENDDLLLADLFEKSEHETDRYRGPFPIIDCSLNLGGSDDLAVHTRHSASFVLTPLFSGSDRRRIGYQQTGKLSKEITLGQAAAISGAASSPNSGYNTSPLIAFLLTMFDLRLGWWFRNPAKLRRSKLRGEAVGAGALLRELRGAADESWDFINLSDGGHFENLGIYELVRRRCKVIIACDAECDDSLTFGSLGNVVRLCETDFGAKIHLDVKSIRKDKSGLSHSHCAVGTIEYSNGSLGRLVYLKASIAGDEDIGVAQYRAAHPTFPHESTADQFFSEDQFESYRRLGHHILRSSFRIAQPGDHLVELAERLADDFVPESCASEIFVKHSHAIDEAWERARTSASLRRLMNELMETAPIQEPSISCGECETLFVLELIQIMENVYLDLRLDYFWDHPDNRGWAFLFMRWARHPCFQAVWKAARRTFGIRFEYFCEVRLGLARDRPIVRVEQRHF